MSRNQGPRPRVCAVVVTFDRVGSLRRCLRSLADQGEALDTVLVVDNGSGPETERFLAEEARRLPSLRVLRLAENLGPAGGFAAGLEAAADGHTHGWAMDDDVVAEPGCLAALLARAAGHGEEVVFPSVVGPEGEEVTVPGWYAVLVATSAIRRAGTPDARLFWWIEDTEYLQWRLPRHGSRVGRAPAARARHEHTRGDSRPAWKSYYEVRNTVYYRLFVQDTSWRRRGTRLVVVVAKAIGRALLRDPDKARSLGFVLRGLWDGLRRDLGKKVDPAGGRRRPAA